MTATVRHGVASCASCILSARSRPFPVSRTVSRVSVASPQVAADRVLSCWPRPESRRVREIVRRLDLDAEGRRELKGVLRELIADGEVVKIRGARVGLPVAHEPRGGAAHLQPRRLRLRGAREDGARREARRLRLRRQHEGGAARRPRGGARRAHDAQGRGGPHHPRPRAGAASASSGRYESDGRFGGHVVPFDRRVLHELFIPPGDEAGARSPAQMVLAEITRPPTATRNPAGRVLEVLGPPRGPGRRPQGRHGQVRPARRLPAGGGGGGGARAARRCGPRTSRAAPTSAPGPPSPWTPRPRATTTTPSASTACPNGGWRLAVHIADVAHYVRAGLAPRPGGLPARHLGLLPRPRGAHAAARALQQHLQPGRGPGPPDPDRGPRARRARARCSKAEFHDGVIRAPRA